MPEVKVVVAESEEAASAIVLSKPEAPVLFRGLGSALGMVKLGLDACIDLVREGRPPACADAAADLEQRTDLQSWTFRAFVAEDRVERMSIADFVDRSCAGEFVYLETASTDLQYGRGHHILDSLAHSSTCSARRAATCGLLSPRPLVGALQERSLFKTRAYLSILAAEKFNVAEWHFDGFHQAILAVTVGGDAPAGDIADPGTGGGCRQGSAFSRQLSEKVFEISPPLKDGISPRSGPVSGWATEPEAHNIQRVSMRTGDVLYLPAGWLHRVTTRGTTFTVNWGLFCPRENSCS